MTELIRLVRPGDETELTAMIHELAEFECAADECTVTEIQLREALFGDQPTVNGHIAEVDGKPAAAALWFRNFSTWDGVAGVYLEDLYVRPAHRRRGIGRAMLLQVARIAAERNCGRLEWSVLDWNEPAIFFYETLGATIMHEWKLVRVMGDALERLAKMK